MLLSRFRYPGSFVPLESQVLIHFLNKSFLDRPYGHLLDLSTDLLHQCLTDRVLETFCSDPFKLGRQRFSLCGIYLAAWRKVLDLCQDRLQVDGHLDVALGRDGFDFRDLWTEQTG
jgi:hypothetical protein